MDFRVLGSLEVRAGDRSVPLERGKLRILLAMLLLRPNRVVAADRLIDAMWCDAAPRSARTQLHGHVSRLRQAMATHRSDEEPLLVTRAPGYLLQLPAGALDVQVFEQTAQRGRQRLASGAVEDAVRELRTALALWRGPAFDGLAAEPIRQEAARLENLRQAVLVDCVDAELSLGRHAELVPELESLVAANPFQERLVGQLVLALHRSGRTAEALSAYRAARVTLADELGVDPGAELQRLHQAVLARDPALDLSEASPPTGPVPAAPRPAQLPADITDFTGRNEQADRVCDLLLREVPDRPVVVSAIAGRGGVGKTTLAVHVGHRLRDVFPDGQLYANLHGNEAAPVVPGTVLGGFLRALGVDGAAIPDALDERAALYRSRVAELRILVVLDNAAGEQQVRPLLPAGRGCAVVVTSRAQLRALEGVEHVDLDVLDTEHAIELLARVTGPARVATEPDAARHIARLCGGLPLAVRIAGARLAQRPDWTLARLAGRLADERHRLDELVTGDLQVRGSLALSYAGLTAQARRGLRLLGLADLADFAAWVLAPLLEIETAVAEEIVDALVRAQLLDAVGVDRTGHTRYRLHDLVRIYARERAEADDPEPQRRAALQRLVGSWLTVATHGYESLHNSGMPRPRRGDAPRRPLDPALTATLLADPLAWFAVEVPSLVAAVSMAETLGLDETAWELFAALVFGRFMLGSQLEEWSYPYGVALNAAQRAGNLRGEAIVECGVGLLAFRQDRYGEALDRFQHAFDIFRATGNELDEAVARCGLAVSLAWQGRSAEGLGHAAAALSAFEDAGDLHGAACATEFLGMKQCLQGRVDDALRTLHRALSEYRRLDDLRGTANASRWIGRCHRVRGDHHTALAWLQPAKDTLTLIGDRAGLPDVNYELALVRLDQGKHDQALAALHECVTEYGEVGRQPSATRVLRTLGDMQPEGRQPDEARRRLHEQGRARPERDLPP